MPSKTSKPTTSRESPWKLAPACSEQELEKIAAELAAELKPGDRVILEGPMGAGKSTFARALLRALKIEQPAEGSPTFAIAHEYTAPVGEVVHIDLYRLKSEQELEDAGIPSYFWGRQAVVIVEWLSMFEAFEETVLSRAPERRRNWRVKLGFVEARGQDLRELRIES